MSIRKAIWFLLALNLAVAAIAIVLFMTTKVNHFGEGRFVTIHSDLQLLLVSVLAIMVDRNTKKQDKLPGFWKIMAVGFFLLACDEQFKLHEKTDTFIHGVFGLQETGMTDRIDDLLIGLAGLIGLGVLFLYRDVVLKYRPAWIYFITAFVLMFGMVGLDAFTNRNDILSRFLEPGLARKLFETLALLEDALKIFAEAFFILGFYNILLLAKSIKKLEADTSLTAPLQDNSDSPLA